MIYALAGLPATKCLTIPAGMANGELSEDEYKARRNKDELENWCGIFALSVWKSAGLNMPAWAEPAGGERIGLGELAQFAGVGAVIPPSIRRR
jgi:hypothetical protein